ncbi:helix-turn-helix domain-containing protein [Sphingomonas kyeonggiensis]|uniref:Transcriptional regulator with XRE-family HTH domain n=1 Tax=Sphingomonas kyeonggiensis TaxID=1268553 RepID=A0A7W6JU68_9SPHN|nr:helix-turn-helix domain-containing protein [Sphingomonas kyeonggiensis]MBB4099600.1 transcriptional regulator with XRE-family HTH domain [Sphingomonas kyeonggiensis]
MEGEAAEDPNLFPATVGDKLRAAREAQGLDLPEIAARTRIPQRHLEAIEKGNYAGLPSITYALGFAKAYARAVGADEVTIARELRAELHHNPERAAPVPAYETSDPARVPPRGLAIFGVILALVLIVGAILYYGTDLFRGSAPAPETLATEEPVANTADNGAVANSVVPVPAGGQVSLIALDTVWIRVTDAKGTKLVERELAPGERYDVPADADHPRIRTGGPEKIQVTLNGSNVDPLGRAGTTVDVEVSADALRNRNQPGAGPIAGAAPTASAPARRERPAAARLSVPTPVPDEPLPATSTGNSTP